LIYLNQKKIEEAISNKPELIDEYVKEIRRKMDNTKSDASLKDFIKTRLKLQLEDVTLRKVPLQGNIGKQQLRQFISTAGRPFIPGSTLKGAFRTAILYDWLVNDNNGKINLSELLKLAKEKKYYDLERFDIVQRCFGSISEDGFRFLRISDSENIAFDKIQAKEVKRVSLFEEESDSIPQPAECLMTQTAINLSIVIQKPNKETGFNFLHNQDIQDLFKKSNTFSMKTIDAELGELDNSEGDRPTLQSFFIFYEKLENQIKSLKPTEVILRIGGGKTYFDNSIGHAIDDDNQLISLLKFVDKRFSALPYPKTRTAVMKNNKPFQPLGWVKLSINE
jgi:CRISPR-associated protein Csm5